MLVLCVFPNRGVNIHVVPSVWMYCFQGVGDDITSSGTGVQWGVRDVERDMSGKRRGLTDSVDCRPGVNGMGANGTEYHQVRHCNNTRTNSARSTAEPGLASKRVPVSVLGVGAFLRVEGVTMRSPPVSVEARPNNIPRRSEQRRTKSGKPKSVIPATSRCLSVYSRSLSLTPDIYSLMHSPREAPSPRGSTPSKRRLDRCKPDSWSPSLSIPPQELTPDKWVRVLRANPGDPILQRAQVNDNARYWQKYRCRRRPVSAGVYETARGPAQQADDSRNVSEAFIDLRLGDGCDMPSLTRCRRPKTAGPSVWTAADSVVINEPKSALVSETPRSSRSTISVTKSALMPQLNTPISNRSTISVTKSAFTPRVETPRSSRSAISVTLPSTLDNCWVSAADAQHHEDTPTHAQSVYPPKTPYNSPKGSVVDLSCGDFDNDTL